MKTKTQTGAWCLHTHSSEMHSVLFWR